MASHKIYVEALSGSTSTSGVLSFSATKARPRGNVTVHLTNKNAGAVYVGVPGTISGQTIPITVYGNGAAFGDAMVALSAATAITGTISYEGF